MKRLLFILAAALLVLGRGAEAADTPIRFGLTAAVVRENLDLYERWAAYLGRKVGRPVQFVQRRTYREAMEMLETGEHDFAWICSFPYAKFRDSKVFGLMAVPVFEGEPLYRSYVIVHKDSSFRTIGDLEGRVFAYSDPDSNSGYIVPRQLLSDLGRNPDSFFRHTFFTYSHTETIEAVAERVADGAAVDSYVWEYLSRREPKFTAKTKVIQRSETFGFPPLVYRTGVDAELRARMTEALLTMDKNPEGQALLAELMLDRFITAPSSLYTITCASISIVADAFSVVTQPIVQATVRIESRRLGGRRHDRSGNGRSRPSNTA
jgi:phosphonate transport system substrate-binding protein